MGECHCKAGYAPPDCSRSGCGGSYYGGSPTPGCVNTLDDGGTLHFIVVFTACQMHPVTCLLDVFRQLCSKFKEIRRCLLVA